MTDRYFVCPPPREDKEDVVLEGPEAHHLIHVMRARAGQRVTLFDGEGCEYEAEIRQIGRADVRLAVHCRSEVDRELSRELVLAVALPKADRHKWLVEKAVELGVARLVPLITHRSVVAAPTKMLHRLGRGVIEASKQCGRNRLMEIAPAQPWHEFVEATRAVPHRWLAHPAGAAPEVAWRAPVDLAGATAGAGAIVLAVGPEGGFTSEEVASATAAGWGAVDLGPRILRVETAAIALVALVALAARLA